jgi:hypothetical protein
VTTIRRPDAGFVSLVVRFWLLLLRSRVTRAQVFLANVNWYHLGLSLKLVPGSRIHTFDDGAANVQEKSAFYTDKLLKLASVRGTIARMLFPGGVARFTRARIAHHYTIYPHFTNIVAPEHCTIVNIDWPTMIAPEDQRCLPAVAGRILIGTVYEEASTLWGLDVDPEKIRRAVAWADLYIPHPRQPTDNTLRESLKRYPAEAIIDMYARKAPITVAHFNSSAALCFASNPAVQLIDLASVGLDALMPATPCPPLEI